MPQAPASALSLVEEGVTSFVVWDFDGVLNPDHITGTFSKAYYNPNSDFRAKNSRYDPLLNWRLRKKEPKSYYVRYSTELMQEVSELHSSPLVQPLMLTTWREESLELLETMGVTSERPLLWLPWGTSSEDLDHLHKIEAFQKFFAGVNAPGTAPVKVAWFDDQVLNPEVRSTLDPVGPSFTDRTARLFCPDMRFGVSRAEMQEARTFLTPSE